MASLDYCDVCGRNESDCLPSATKGGDPRAMRRLYREGGSDNRDIEVEWVPISRKIDRGMEDTWRLMPPLACAKCRVALGLPSCSEDEWWEANDPRDGSGRTAVKVDDDFLSA